MKQALLSACQYIWILRGQIITESFYRGWPTVLTYHKSLTSCKKIDLKNKKNYDKNNDFMIPLGWGEWGAYDEEKLRWNF